ncbi:MAG: PHP domain-containing protein [Phycisphaeraceae bacterium]
MSIDLHMHSTASDGTDAPAGLVARVKAAGLSAMALTDHDTTAGLPACAAAAAELGITFVPGIELSADMVSIAPANPTGTLHILGYHVRHDSEKLRRVTESLNVARAARNPRIVDALNALGVDITLEEVEAEAAGGVIGRPHIAAVLVRHRYADSIAEAFKRYIGIGGAAYHRKDNLSAHGAIEAIHEAGGVAVLAHPVQMRCIDETDFQRRLERLVEWGLDGIEIWHSDHQPHHTQQYQAAADQFDLIVTGGSDYHGERKTVPLGAYEVPEWVLERLAAVVGTSA